MWVLEIVLFSIGLGVLMLLVTLYTLFIGGSRGIRSIPLYDACLEVCRIKLWL
jgi:hypothetical protein